MVEQFAEGNFLGLPDFEGAADVVIAPVPYELTTSMAKVLLTVLLHVLRHRDR